MSPRSPRSWRCWSRSREALCASPAGAMSLRAPIRSTLLYSQPHLQELLLNKDSLSSPSAQSAPSKTLKSDSRSQAVDLHLYPALHRSHILTDARHVSSSKSDDKTSLPLYLPKNGCTLQSIISIIFHVCDIKLFQPSNTSTVEKLIPTIHLRRCVY